MPIFDRQGEIFAVAQLLNKRDAAAFSKDDEENFRKFRRAAGRDSRNV